MTLDEAEKELRTLKASWFCPLINGTCNPKCLCYVKPYASNIYSRTTTKTGKRIVHRLQLSSTETEKLEKISLETKEKYKADTPLSHSDDWYIRGNYCNNAMFSVEQS